MHKDFHLYATYMASIEAGYSKDDAAKIACAAQMVDEFGKNLINENITVTPMISEVVKSIFSDKKEKEIADIWVPFHFIPQNKPDYIEGSTFKKYQCGYGENVIKTIIDKMQEPLYNASLEQIGIVMHVLADSFAHKEFCGVPCKDYDKISEVKCYMLAIPVGLENSEYVPNYLPHQAYFGHGCVGHLPDLSWVQYEYYWKSGKIGVRNNPEIFAEAYKTMAKELSRFRGNALDKENRNRIYNNICGYLKEKSFEKQKDSYNALMKGRAINSANQLFNEEISAVNSDLKNKISAVHEKLKKKQFTYEQVVQNESGNYEIQEITDTAFNLYMQKPVTVGVFDEDSDNLFEKKCTDAELLKNTYAEYRKNIQDENSDLYRNFKKAAIKHKVLYETVI